jgi:eukaryotic-like serine/threonine-protein kinase
MAPEQARGEPTGPPADFWALGATMFYAVEGKPPFDKGSSMATLAAVVNEAPQPMRRAGPLAPLLADLLAKDPRARPSGPKARAWLAWLLVVTPSAPPIQMLPPPEPPERLAPRPSRPILPPAPPAPRRAGRRLLGVAALLLAAWLTDAFRSDPTPDRAAPVATSRGLGVSPAEDQSARATPRSGAGATGTTRPASPTTKEPASTRAPTTPTTAAPETGLPAGWRVVTNRAGNHRIGVPPGFRVRTRQRYHAAVVEEQGRARRLFTVRSQTPSAQLPQASRDYRAWARRNLAGFREVRYDEGQTYAGHGGAVIFEYEAVRDGRRVHVSHINLKGRTWGYNVELIAPADRWDASRELARQFEQAFQPLG